MNRNKNPLKKALGILIHLSELSGKAKSFSGINNDDDYNSKGVDYYQTKREELKKLIIDCHSDIKVLDEKLIQFKNNLS